jgi:phosphatidate cytidylyltransferase
MLLTRILTAIVLVIVLAIVLFWLPTGLALAALALLTLAGAWEWAAFAGLERNAGRVAYVAGCLVLMTALWGFVSSEGGFRCIMTITLLWWMIAFLWVALAPTRGRPVLAGLAGLAALAPMWVAMAQLFESGDLGRELLIFALVLGWAADVGAYFGGRRFGRTKLAPRVSPNKTWEGVLGGLLVGSAVAFAGLAWFGFIAAAFLPLCIAALLASVVGDLTESMFKRQVGLKDSGTILPGHGGVLDRIDSLTAAIPVLSLGLSWMGVVS